MDIGVDQIRRFRINCQLGVIAVKIGFHVFNNIQLKMENHNQLFHYSGKKITKVYIKHEINIQLQKWEFLIKISLQNQLKKPSLSLQFQKQYYKYIANQGIHHG
ncbi:unnamed protein product (macronuclear) [Paramecium tetraurelia]|uniref:Uncharacterized protein n=1 Tax=Paramecium tetraurelia TaxID=5888 RepID=A0CE32_PARTE|nr:uncharacterized protein GSPATT00007261001 [Paramecium tetraurelia]CAK69049.1 unnamed protein product [Paramecium tetraurelia]|eukprot:XP_001436446.1 hypothetical protein (macronuclear) [Paramecium tetraurelia strain d4-2]